MPIVVKTLAKHSEYCIPSIALQTLESGEKGELSKKKKKKPRKEPEIQTVTSFPSVQSK